MDDVKPDAPVTGRRYPVCRLVLQPLAAVDLINRMQQVGAALAKAGVVKANPPAAPQAKDVRREVSLGALAGRQIYIKKSLYMRCGAGGGLL